MKVKNPQRRQRLRAQVKRDRRTQKEQAHFTEPLTGRRARHIAGASANAEYGPVIRAAKAEKRGSVQREKNIGQWYGELGQEIEDQVARAQAGEAALQGTVDTRLAAARTADQATLSALAATDAATAKKLGGSPSSAGLTQIAAGDSARAQQGIALNFPTAAEGKHYVDYLGSRRVSASERGIEARRSERSRRLKIAQDIVAAKKERGQKKVANLNDLRTAERENQIDKMAFTTEKPYEKALREQARLGLKGTKISARATTTAAKQYAGARRQSAAATVTASQEARKGKNRSASAQEKVAGKYSKGGGGSSGYNTREAVGLLEASEQDFPTPRAAVNYLINRGVDAETAKRAVGRALHRGKGKK